MSSLSHSMCFWSITIDRSFFKAVIQTFLLFCLPFSNLLMRAPCYFGMPFSWNFANEAKFPFVSCHGSFIKCTLLSGRLSAIRSVFAMHLYYNNGEMVEKADKLTHTNIDKKYVQIHLIRAFFQFVDLRRKSWIHFFSFLLLAHDILSMFGALNGVFDDAIRFHISLAFMIFWLFVYLAFFFFKFSSHFSQTLQCYRKIHVLDRIMYWIRHLTVFYPIK